MESLWNDREADRYVDDHVGICVYMSRLLGADRSLVMHGGGNTSVKSVVEDFYGRAVETLFVKGSGCDLATIEKVGFSGLRLAETRMLAERDSLSDPVMANQLRANLIDVSSPAPSVESILHAIMPARFVAHTHADAVVTLSNTPDGAALIGELYPDVLVLPYVMPGFRLAKQVYDALRQHAGKPFKGIVLLHHGVFTFAEDAKQTYETMIELVDRADRYISANVEPTKILTNRSAPDLLTLARIRSAVSKVRSTAQLARLNSTAVAQSFAAGGDVAQSATRGPITPDHVLWAKRTAMILDESPEETVPEVEAFAEGYRDYFERYDDGSKKMLDGAPRWAVWKNVGTLAFGSTLRECGIVSDITDHTVRAIENAQSLGGWTALPAKDIFDLEYWMLEQAKRSQDGSAALPHVGKIAIVTGAAAGIGRATAQQLHRDGAVVVGLDINPDVTKNLNAAGLTGEVCDLTDETAVKQAIESVVLRYGGLDIVVLNAGIFKSGETIDQLSAVWDDTLAVNLTASQRFLKHAIPFLKLGIDASAIFIGSRNYSAPGAGAAAYSVSKAGVTQLARVAALELARDHVRVNVIHPDAVFDTQLWTEEALKRSAARYNLSVQEYKTKNLLGVEIGSADVARMVSMVASDVFRATTGAQIPIDGGSDRVI